MAAFILKSTIHVIQGVVTSLFAANEINYWYLALPAVGITFASLFVRYVVKDDISHGVTKILYAISQHKAIPKLLKNRLTCSMPFSAAFKSSGSSIPHTLRAIWANLYAVFSDNKYRDWETDRKSVV